MTLLDRLPPVRGRIRADARLAPLTWFKVGGTADVLFRPEDADDLRTFLRNKPAEVPVTVLGAASNTLVRDGGIRGVVVRLGRGFAGISMDGEDGLIAGAGALCATAAKQALLSALAGLAFLSGIPGAIGGALRMNAGAYGGETRHVLDWAEVLDPNGGQHRLTARDLGYAYRHSDLVDGWIFTRARFFGTPNAEGIAAEMARIASSRATSQPIGSATGGSTFRNPPGHKAWQLIDSVGGRGLRVGGAQISEKHCNFMINTGNATAADLEMLGETVRTRVLETHGIALQWEIKRIGESLVDAREEAVV
jgi:UDP-N-acetylmuramate dehydrogenase